MAKYGVSLKVHNSGSPNDLPCKGAASECYVAVGAVPQSGSEPVNTAVFYAKGICNGETYTKFTEMQSEKETNEVEINLDKASALVFTFSIYYGNRAFDALLIALMQKFFGKMLGQAWEELPDEGYLGTIEERLKVYEKKLLEKLKKEGPAVVVPIGAETFAKQGNQLQGEQTTFRILSDVDISSGFLDRTIIAPGDLAAEITLTKIA